MADHTLEKIEAWLVASGQDVGDAGARDAEGLGELGLADVFSGQKLLQTLVHFSKRFVYKSNESFSQNQQLQMAIVDSLLIR